MAPLPWLYHWLMGSPLKLLRTIAIVGLLWLLAPPFVATLFYRPVTLARQEAVGRVIVGVCAAFVIAVRVAYVRASRRRGRTIWTFADIQDDRKD